MVENFEKIKNELKQLKKKDKEKGIFKGKFLKKVKLPIQSRSPEKVLTQGAGHYALVKEGKTGYFNDEYAEEIKWLN